ncbi:phosphatidylserine decarboxylase proenzyme 1, mitochondrial precursor [Aspergillus terreus NIH2624]|uniref:Phosphatidylserine decarboxylase proenzyme 1, mitochondrial n=1 Tax=Aspergillus terreus (strain NIH 2624 / FGSC A1156) TaxID=341663 RepID=Q0CM66_ASPTN|nr:phosphatidylserine decarboxylase proenzyme 1, mitochondrial precursor [Aspergillus terreus NIH2624]EAU34287.1 phosphatidylserine decarboxylase proenzyme 1, mitochondrial precursor [Aspergillus terreus NIH2624]KAG2420977.1 phosphatidylserine decarboxylase proenzyme 1 [Aspergillus terreus]
MALCLTSCSVPLRRNCAVFPPHGQQSWMNMVAFRAAGGRKPSARQFSKSWKQYNNNNNQEHPSPKGFFGSRLRFALRNTKVEWYPIPVGLGIGLLGLLQFYKSQRAERERIAREAEEESFDFAKPPPRHRIRPSGPWQVQIMSTLPLKAISRLWGRFNELELPVCLRAPGFKLYSWAFGVNLDEVAEPDLRAYPNLAAFFYRKLKPGVRPLDPDPHAVLSPSDGRILQFGLIERGEVEQVKGVTYSLDALLGSATPTTADHSKKFTDHQMEPSQKDAANMNAHEEFARMNGISYTLPTLFAGDEGGARRRSASLDASTQSKPSAEAEVKADLARGDGTPWYAPKPTSNNALYYVVIYLAPGDYHRFHSPVPWVVESRRHFAGELFSVSPYLQRHLPGLFTLNERVVLLGRWRWGFFSYTPVGATNVGSIKVNFDAELRTNSLTTDTAADMAAHLAAKRGEQYPGFVEATYLHASRTLGGHPLQRGEEMGGFQLGSSIVLVFEAPMGTRKSFDAGWEEGKREGGWNWSIEKGQRIKVGQKLGYVDIKE